MNLNCKKAFISGACEGIGFAVAKLLISVGCEVMIHDKDNKQKCKDAIQLLNPSGLLNIPYVIGDFGTKDDLDVVLSKLGDIDILIINASTQSKVAFELIEKDLFDQHVNTNLWSTIVLIQNVLPNMKAKNHGRIITIGSIQESKPHPQMAVYACLKAATSNLVKNLAGQYAEFGITINNVAPGVISTARNKEALSNPTYAQSMLNKIPNGNFGTPDDCAGIVYFLASDLGKYITGQTIYCDGGMSL